jgi:asparagine synthase (glutamine-hydrolysing)
VSVSRYWELPRDPVIEPVHSEAEYFHEVRAHFEDAVRSRLVSDVPLGAFLSGEIDSAAVVAVMTRLLGHSVSTFAIGFADEPSFNELKYARLVAQQFGADHHEFIVKPDVIELLPKLVWHYDQPFADSSALPIYYVAQLAREHVKVALTGDGGDELFVGYERFAAARMAEFHRRTPPILRGAVSRLVHALPESTSYFGLVRRARQFVERASLPLPERYLEWVGIFKPDFLHELLLDSTEIDTAGHLRGYFDARQAANPIAQLLTLNMASDSLVKMDRMTMANSLEARCPFLDDQLLARASKIPSQLKLKGMTTNYILKRAFEGILPREIVRRKKHGFGVPVGRWFRAGLKDFLCDTILSPEALQRGYFREPVVRTLVGEHMSGKRDHGHRLWALLTFEIWHRLFIDQGVSPWFPDLTKPRPGSYGSPARIGV